MSNAVDDLRRRSLGTAGSPPQYAGGNYQVASDGSDGYLIKLIGLPPHHAFPARNMPPPSPTTNAPPLPGSHTGSALRGPLSTTPFGGNRDYSSHRPGMSISAMLGGGEERRTTGSPHSSTTAPPPMPRSMQPPSPGRARASSMREGLDHGMNGYSPSQGGVFREPARMASEPRKEGGFGSPPYRHEPQHSFRAFQAPTQEHLHHVKGHGGPPRPNSQPAEAVGPRQHMEEMMRQDDNRANMLRHYGESPAPHRSDMVQRHERPPFQKGITSHPQERAIHNSPQMGHRGQQPPPPQQVPPMRYQTGSFGASVREEQAPLFRPAFQSTSHPAPDQPRESIEGRAPDMRRQTSHQSPQPPVEYAGIERGRPGIERPVTLEEHQRVEMLHREQQYREGEGSVHKAVLNLSPELNRRGRNSPLPQAVQGAQPRHVGPGGDNPGIKMEFGRMFSGLGSGAGSTTPHASYHANGTHTPSRNSPARQPGEPADARGAIAEIDDARASSKAGTRGGKKNGRRSREEMDAEGRYTPDSRGNKRAKAGHPTGHPHHHHHHHHAAHTLHHHHHRHEPEAAMRAASNPLSQANLAANQAQHHHHHHHHAHPVPHHHHHPPRAIPHPPHKPAVTVLSKRVLEDSASKPRKHLGSQLYTTEVSMAPAAETTIDAKIKFSSKMIPIPVFEGRENSTFTIRVPRYYLASSESGQEDNFSLEEICKRRQLWGTDIYSDDSDVVAAAVHSGWIKGDFGDWNQDLHVVCDNASELGPDEETALSLTTRPKKPVRIPEGHDAHITILILPPLEKYASTHQHHIWSRQWEKTHNGMSYMIHSVDFVDEGPASRFMERGASGRKSRMALEEANRREAAAGLLMFANGAGTVSVGA